MNGQRQQYQIDIMQENETFKAKLESHCSEGK